MLSNLFGSLGLDSTLKRMLNVIARFSFDNVGRLRVYADAPVSINANQTLANVTVANVSVGDMGKNNTAIAQSIQTVATIRRNWKWG